MGLTDYHAKYYAYTLSRKCPSDSLEKFATALLDSKVDLNPHQIDAALFSFNSPLSKGAILADEVGLGKTIEAGIVLSQKWAERKRKILLILPASLRKQWYQELQDKFYLPAHILENTSFNKTIKDGVQNPFETNEIVICSYNYAANKSEYIKAIKWDLVVIDEAHRLRNVYKPQSKMANKLKLTLKGTSKLLLTATPLQNSLLELYGLVSFIDEHSFGDLKSFKAQFSRLTEDNFNDLKERLKPICKRTLRKQVLEYIRFTERKLYTQEFIPTLEEEKLYEMVSDYLRRENLQALPSSQRGLMTLVLRKMLASSTFAIAGGLASLAEKLKKRLKDNDEPTSEELKDDFEGLDEMEDEWDVKKEEPKELSFEEREAIEEEIKDLEAFRDLAMSINVNSKGQSLLKALNIGFEMTESLGGTKKAIVFTESIKTQSYLVNLLSKNGYKDDLVLFNGSNNDEESRRIYEEWKEKYKGTNKITKSKEDDIRAALVDYFRNSAKIMIATEAAAEGINLQFCSLVVNYDLPWNPQRIEQRIGRCHRYGQMHDVVVVNFLNKKNAADQRVYELLRDKFQLFSGIFGASDEILGTIDSGMDLEKRIAEIYQTCRTPKEIQISFDKLHEDMSEQIDEKMSLTRQKLFENFDVVVAEKLDICKKESQEYINKYENYLWDLTEYTLKEKAQFYPKNLSFKLSNSLGDDVPKGCYSLKRNDDLKIHYRLNHPLAIKIITDAKNKESPDAELIFDYSGNGCIISVLKPFLGKSGILSLSLLRVESLESEEHIILSAICDDGTELDKEECSRLLTIPATVMKTGTVDETPIKYLFEKQKNSIWDSINKKNSHLFDEEMDKLDKWALDRQKTLQNDLKEKDNKIIELRTKARYSNDLSEKLLLQKRIKELNKERNVAWKEYDEAARTIEDQKDELLDQLASRLKQDIKEDKLFTIKWTLK